MEGAAAAQVLATLARSPATPPALAQCLARLAPAGDADEAAGPGDLGELEDAAALVERKARVGTATWAAVIVCELAALKNLLCELLDTAAAQLAFWRDVELMPLRGYVLRVAKCPGPDLHDLEVAMLVLMELLGDCELVLRSIAQNWAASSKTRRRAIVRRALWLQVRLADLENSPGTAARDAERRLADFATHAGFVRHELHAGLKDFVQRHTEGCRIPRWWRYRWPELLAAASAGLVAAYAVATGAVQTWLDAASLARRGNAIGVAEPVAGPLAGGVLALFSMETWSTLWARCRKKASAWVNKKILDHVTTPTRNLINELIDFRELEARIEIFNKDDEVALRECQLRLQELFAEETAQRAASKTLLAEVPAAAASERLTGAALAQFTTAHEFLVRYPHRAVLGGSRAMRPLLVNLYYVKAEIYYVLKAMHVLNRGANFHFEMMAMVPALLAFRGAFRALQSLLFARRRRRLWASRGGYAISQRLRFILRDLEQLANRNAHAGNDPASLGRYLMLSHQFRATVAEHLEPSMHPMERARLAAFWRALAQFSGASREGLLGRFIAVIDAPPP